MDKTEELLMGVPESVFATTWGREAVAELKRLAQNVKTLQEALAQREIPREALVVALKQAGQALQNVPAVSQKYDQQHSDTHMAASVAITDALKASLAQSEIPRFRLLHSGKNPHGFTAEAGRTGDPGIYEEVRIGIVKDGESECHADVLVGLADGDTGEPRVLVSADANGDEHRLAIFPMRPAREAVVPWDE